MRSSFCEFVVGAVAGIVLLWSCGVRAAPPVDYATAAGVEDFPGAVIANGKKIFNEGKGDDVPACTTCHGPTGWGMDALGAPRLARIGFPYVVKQLSDLSHGRRVPSGVGAVMVVYASGLSAQEQRDVAGYVNSLNSPPEISNLSELKEGGAVIGESYLGQAIVKYGVLGKVSACSSCHGFNGRGAAPVFPVIGQQKFTYLVNQLNNWRDGSRANDPYAMMRKMASGLTDADIANLATYLASAPLTTNGNPVVPVTNQ